MAWNVYDEAVEMMGLRHRFLPELFRWRGRHHSVESVERCWTVSRGRRRQNRFFRVQCREGAFELYQDLVAGTWHLRRAMLAPSRVRAAGRQAVAWR